MILAIKLRVIVDKCSSSDFFEIVGMRGGESSSAGVDKGNGSGRRSITSVSVLQRRPKMFSDCIDLGYGFSPNKQ